MAILVSFAPSSPSRRTTTLRGPRSRAARRARRWGARAASSLPVLLRRQELVAPRGQTVLLPGDHVYVLERPEDRAFVELLFGSPEEL
jgi:NhaP-type Na+/H+ and K+/H+ antiporter